MKLDGGELLEISTTFAFAGIEPPAGMATNLPPPVIVALTLLIKVGF